MTLTAERLRAMLSYDEASGQFTWLVTQGAKKAGSIAGSRGPNNTVQIRVDGKLHLAHRLAWLFMLGKFPSLCIDHIDHDASNNKWNNLREVSHVENMRNMKLHRTNTSGFSGVVFHPATRKWRARMWVDGRGVHLGLFHSKEDAAAARKNAEGLMGYHENHGKAA